MKEEPKWHEGTLDIARPSGGGRDDAGRYFTLELKDNASRVQLIEIEISAEDLALGMSSLSARPVRFQIQGIARVGYKAEHREEIVEMPPSGDWKTRKEKAAAFLAAHPLTKDGWRGNADDATNRHCCVGGNKYRVSFRRHVHPETGEPFRQ